VDAERGSARGSRGVEQEHHALCEGCCQGPDRTTRGPAVNIEAVLPKALKKERTSGGGGIQEESLASKNKESQEKVSWMYRR
jgi:hypothetical protein